jgi:hypothetical protein
MMSPSLATNTRFASSPSLWNNGPAHGFMIASDIQPARTNAFVGTLQRAMKQLSDHAGDSDAEKTVGSFSIETSFHDVANKRDWCTMVPLSRSIRKSG